MKDIVVKQSIKIFLLATLLTITEIINAADELETKVKAVYIFNFTKFVEWTGISRDTLNICVLGNRAIAEILNDLVSHNTGRKIRIEQDQLTDVTQCQMLYIDHSEKTFADLLVKVRGTKVLTISDAKSFAENGGIIGFYIDEGKVKLEINPHLAEASDLKISSNLLEIARIVH